MTVASESEPLTMAGLAAHYGVSRQTIYNWKNANCPVHHGLEAIDRWLESNRPNEEDATDLREQKLKWQVAKTRAEAEAKELDNAERRGELVSRSEIVQEFAEFLTHAKSVLEAMVEELAKAAPQTIRVEQRAVAKHHVDMAKRKLAAWRPGKQIDGP